MLNKNWSISSARTAILGFPKSNHPYPVKENNWGVPFGRAFRCNLLFVPPKVFSLQSLTRVSRKKNALSIWQNSCKRSRVIKTMERFPYLLCLENFALKFTRYNELYFMGSLLALFLIVDD
jgi:hypothetical protein